MSCPIIERLAKLDAEATPFHSLTVNRYAHGGGRIFLDGDSGDRALVADFFDEIHREHYVATRNTLPAILRVLRAAIAVDENTLPSGFPYPVVPAEHINELHWAIDALRALEVK